ncbi:MAG: hypothetical protein J7647_15165 [Cyanobacteria bacterium SBLK]|nr:hypothetical protein [Cyanobacteria bacterium SBLK]
MENRVTLRLHGCRACRSTVLVGNRERGVAIARFFSFDLFRANLSDRLND